MKNITLFMLMTLMVTVMVVGCLSCSPAKKAAKAERILKDQGKLTDVCAREFPSTPVVSVRDSIHYDTLWGLEEQWFIDSVSVRDTVRITRTVPKTVVKTVTREVTIEKENKAKILLLEASLLNSNQVISDLNKKLSATEQKLQHWKGKSRRYFWWLIAVAALILGFSIRKLMKK